MYLTNQTILLPTKESQQLQNVKTMEMDDRELTRALRDAINSENEGIKKYEVIVDSTNNKDIKKVLQDISNEEKVHVGELQSLLSILLSDEDDLLEKGRNEVNSELLGNKSEEK